MSDDKIWNYIDQTFCMHKQLFFRMSRLNFFLVKCSTMKITIYIRLYKIIPNVYLNFGPVSKSISSNKHVLILLKLTKKIFYKENQKQVWSGKSEFFQVHRPAFVKEKEREEEMARMKKNKNFCANTLVCGCCQLHFN